MTSVKNFFSRIFLSKGDTGPTNQKEKVPGKRDSILNRIFGSDDTRTDAKKELSELSRPHSEFTITDLDDSSETRTRMSLDGTLLLRTPAIHTGSKMRTSLQKSTSPLENQEVSEIIPENCIKRRASDTRRLSSTSTRKSLLSLIYRRKSTGLRREHAALNKNELDEMKGTLEELPSNLTGDTLLSVFDFESTELKREINYSSSRELRNSLHCESVQLPSIPADLRSMSSQ